MAAVSVTRVLNSTTNNKNHDRFNNSECRNCGGWINEMQSLKSEISSLSEIITVRQEETKPTGVNKLTCTDPTNPTNCDNWHQLELQLQTVQNAVSSLKLITNTLIEESKSLTPSPPASSNTINPWTVTTVNNRYSSRTSIHPQSSPYETARRGQYALPFTNSYAALSNSQLTNDSMYSPAPNNNRGTPRKLPSTAQRNTTRRSPLRNFKTKTQRLITWPTTTHKKPIGTKKKQDTSQQCDEWWAKCEPNSRKRNNSLVQHQTVYIKVPSIIYVKLLKPKQQRTHIFN